MKLLALAGALFLASCQAAEAPRHNATQQPTAAAVKPTPQITGTWQVIALNGRPLGSAAYPIIVTIKDREISARSQCLKLYWTYRLSAAALSTRRARVSEPVCERSRKPTEQLFDRIMTSAKQLRHLTDGGLYITNRTETMVLRRPKVTGA